MARGGKRPGAGRKPNPHKGKPANPTREPQAARSYDPEVAYQAQKLCALGATDMELADFFGVHIDTIYQWRIEFVEFSEAVRVGKEPADNRVERSYFLRAVGYTYEAVKIFMPAGAKKPVYAPYREHVPPDPGAAFNWLVNRRKDDWRNKQQFEHAGADGGPITLEALLMARIKPPVKPGDANG